MVIAAEATEFLTGVRGRECWSVIGGAGSGSVVSLRFGAKIRSKRPLRNPALSLEERNFEGERSLIIYCDWRLEAGGAILSSSQNTNDYGDLEMTPFDGVKNNTVTDIAFSSPMHDLRIEFSSGIALSIFCDLAVRGDGDSNYVMFNPLTCISVTTQGKLIVERR
jgi:hypothetical protein